MNSAHWDQRYAGRELVWTSEPNRFLVQEVDGLTPGRALDLATGEGRNAIWLAERGWQVTGVDFSKVGLDKARQLANARGVHAEWILADLATGEVTRGRAGGTRRSPPGIPHLATDCSTPRETQ